MITRWHLSNFKAFSNAIELGLAPLTLFMGANSSGKSTILQSILLIKQTLQYAAPDKPLALNGPLVRLGDFQDVATDFTSSSRFMMGWTLDFRTRAHRPSGPYGPWLEEMTNFSIRTLHAVSTNLTFGPAQTSDKKTEPSIEVSLVEAAIGAKYDELGEDTEQDFRVEIDQPRQGALKSPLPLSPLRPMGRPQDSRLFRVKFIGEDARTELLGNLPKGATIVGTQLQNFFPAQYLLKFDENERRIESILAHLLDASPAYRIARIYRNSELPNGLVETISRWLRDQLQSRPRLSVYRRNFEDELSTNVQELGNQLKRALRSLRTQRDGTALAAVEGDIQKLREIVESELRAQLPLRPSTGFEFDSISVCDEARDLAKNYFSAHVRYLGPLRDDPKPLYPIEGVTAFDDVGYRGEHTAAVLDANRNKLVEYIGAHSFTEKNHPLIKLTGNLLDAVVNWLVYLGVAENVSTLDRGKLGHELKVLSDPDGREHDLTNVGVGVSQVLPIVVMALVASPGSTLIFEQPELHLHPKVQTRLADFFISMASLGKQCLLETHSEYLVHRLRLRIAQDSENDMSELARLYFIEREGRSASCREVKINKYGAIIDWPKDFFDQVQEEIDAILDAATVKARTLRRE